jgi:glycine betaine/choline ABC-type transport system substrate-binding protein
LEIYWGEVIFSFLFLNKYAVPLLKQKTLEKYPEVETLMSKLEPYLTDEVMQEMNY